MRSSVAELLALLCLLLPACAGRRSPAEEPREPRWELRDEADDLMSNGWLLVDRGRWVDARALAERALSLSEADADTYGTIRARDLLGTIAARQGEYKVALELMTPALLLAEQHVGSHSQAVANFYQNLGKAYAGYGDLDKALSMLQKSIEVRRAARQPRDDVTVTTYRELGMVYQKLGNYEHALLMYQRALDIEVALRGEEMAARSEAREHIFALCRDGHRPACY